MERSCPISLSSCLCGTCIALFTYVSAGFRGDLRFQLRVHHHHVVHFPSFMQFIDNCLRASSICLPYTAHALSWACPISHTPPAFSSGKSGITIWFPRGLTLLSFSPFLFFMALIWNEKLRCCILRNCIAIRAARDKFPPYRRRRIQSSSAGLTRNQMQDGFSVQWTEERYCCVVGHEWPVEARSDRLVCAVLHWTVPFGGKASAMKTRKREKEGCLPSNW